MFKINSSNKTKLGTRLKTLAILALSLTAILSATGISYAKYQKSLILAEPTAGKIAGKFSTNGNLQPKVEVAAVATTQAPAQPSRIIIPDIGVNAQIESLGLTADNAVDVPKSLWTTAWFNQSSKPGSPGPAMIVGHYSAYGKAVFANLKKLTPGQKIIVTDEKAQQFTFAVTQKRDWPQAEVPMGELLGNRTSKPRLEIITCGGGYIKASRDFTNRTVITAEIVET